VYGSAAGKKNNPSENEPRNCTTQIWRYKTIVVIKRQQQTTISNKHLCIWALIVVEVVTVVIVSSAFSLFL